MCAHTQTDRQTEKGEWKARVVELSPIFSVFPSENLSLLLFVLFRVVRLRVRTPLRSFGPIFEMCVLNIREVRGRYFSAGLNIRPCALAKISAYEKNSILPLLDVENGRRKLFVNRSENFLCPAGKFFFVRSDLLSIVIMTM